jgi:hypothetical protein
MPMLAALDAGARFDRQRSAAACVAEDMMGAAMRATGLSILLGLTILIAPAAAQQCVGAPGTGAIEQYCETVQGSSGPQRSGDPDSHTAVVPDSTLRELGRSGDSGRELRGLLQGDTPNAGRVKSSAGGGETAKRGRPRETRPAAVPPAAQDSTNPLGAVRAAVASGDTVGPGFPWALIVITVGIGGGAWLRHRHGARG